MFTEEKRAEMDLEGLWDVRNTRRAGREERAQAEAEAAVKELRQQEERLDEVEEGIATGMDTEVDHPEKRDGIDDRPMGSMGAS